MGLRQHGVLIFYCTQQSEHRVSFLDCTNGTPVYCSAFFTVSSFAVRIFAVLTVSCLQATDKNTGLLLFTHIYYIHHYPINPISIRIVFTMTSDTKEKEEAKNSPVSDSLVEKLQGIAKPAMELLYIALPYMIQFGRKAHALWSNLDDNVIAAIIGFVFCFFGGMYPTVFSAIQVRLHLRC